MDAIRPHPLFPDVSEVKIPPQQEMAVSYQPEHKRWIVQVKDSRLQIHAHVVVLPEATVAFMFYTALGAQLAPMLAAMGQGAPPGSPAFGDGRPN